MSTNIRFPNITATTPAGQLQQMHSFMYQLVEQLNWALENVESQAFQAKAVVTNSTSSGASSEKEAQPNFNSIKSLIIKSADIVNAYYDEIHTRLAGEYVAVSDFGTYEHLTEVKITENSEGVKKLYSSHQEISNSVANLKQTVIDATAFINSGILYFNDPDDEDNYIEEIATGAPVYGLEIGERVSDGQTVTFNQFARFVANRLSFYDNNGTKVSWISDKKLHIKNAEITVSLTTGALVDTVLSDGSVVTK